MGNEQMKICSRCKTEKSISEFNKSKPRKGGLNCWCRECFNKYQRDRRKLVPKSIKYGKDRKHNLCYKYGISLTDYNIMFQKQIGYCAICGKCQSKLKKPLYVDHNHLTGKVRGLLCGKCNSALGYLDVDNSHTLFLINAINYLKGDTE